MSDHALPASHRPRKAQPAAPEKQELTNAELAALGDEMLEWAKGASEEQLDNDALIREMMGRVAGQYIGWQDVAEELRAVVAQELGRRKIDHLKQQEAVVHVHLPSGEVVSHDTDEYHRARALHSFFGGADTLTIVTQDGFDIHYNRAHIVSVRTPSHQTPSQENQNG